MKTKDCALGSKIVKVTIPDISDDGIDILSGLIESEPAPYPDYDLVFFHGSVAGFKPDISNFEPTDMPLGQIRSELSYPTRVAYDFHTNSIVVYDPGTAVCAIWSQDIASYPYWARSTPFRLGLSWIADSFDGEFLHGALISKDEDAVVLAGKGGSGKSTTAIAAQAAGFDLLSDDYFLYESDRMYPVYTRAKLLDSSFEFIPKELNATSLNPDILGQKRILDLNIETLHKYRHGVQVKNFVIPRLSEEHEIKMVSTGFVLRNLAPYSLCGILGGTQRSMLRIKRAVMNKSGWLLNLSSNATQNNELLHKIIEYENLAK